MAAKRFFFFFFFLTRYFYIKRKPFEVPHALIASQYMRVCVEVCKSTIKFTPLAFSQQSPGAI